jgi:4-hydroxybenzoate polyprenyltransferase
MTRDGRTVASDIGAGGALGRVLPAGLVPYAHLARLDRPIGTWLLLLPCYWGMALAWAAHPEAASGWEHARLAVLFALGALVMRGAGCTYNDIVDRDIDGRVARTAERPIPSGRVSVARAWAFLGAQLLVGAVILFALDPAAILVGLASLPLIALYPWMKRITWWPQAMLGVTFNWGVLVGWAAVTGGLSLAPVLLYLAGVAWTLGYDTIYAHQDREDDALIGVRSTARLFGDATRPWLVGFYATAIALVGAAGLSAGLGWMLVAALLPAALQLAWQVRTVRLDEPRSCLDVFRSNRWAGWLVALALLAGGVAAR